MEERDEAHLVVRIRSRRSISRRYSFKDSEVIVRVKNLGIGKLVRALACLAKRHRRGKDPETSLVPKRLVYCAALRDHSSL